jgi:hypothetical protein
VSQNFLSRGSVRMSFKKSLFSCDPGDWRRYHRFWAIATRRRVRFLHLLSRSTSFSATCDNNSFEIETLSTIYITYHTAILSIIPYSRSDVLQINLPPLLKDDIDATLYNKPMIHGFPFFIRVDKPQIEISEDLRNHFIDFLFIKTPSQGGLP